METSAADEESRKRKHSDDDQYSKLLDIILSFNQVLGLPPLGQSKEKDMSTKGRKLRHMMFGHEFYFAVSTKLAS